MQSIPEKLWQRLAEEGQLHLLTGWETLSPDRQSRFIEQLATFDFARFRSILRTRHGGAGVTLDARERARRAQPPRDLVKVDDRPEAKSQRIQAHQIGEQLLQEGRVGAILVAGGQGSRLGFDAPKGMFPIGPLSQRSLFQVLAEQLLARSRRAGRPIPWFIMTSDATHEQTREFFLEQEYFGLDPADVVFFQQGSLPAVADDSDKLLLSEPGVISTSPDGHGGLLTALVRHGLLEEMGRRGIDHLYYHQVDNPTAIVCDPVFLGEHLQAGSEMSTKVVAKTNPWERMGAVVEIDGRTQIIEYSDLTREEATRTDAQGRHIFWAGSTAIHLFRRDFFERLQQDGVELPFHIAHKAVPYLNEQGQIVTPSGDQPNAHKFEQFIFDALPHARRALVVEVDRSREFNPVKNAAGADSPETCRLALSALAKVWLAAAGVTVAPGVEVELSPLFALDAEELGEKLRAQELTNITAPLVLSGTRGW